MFDRMIFNIKISSDKEASEIAVRNRLEKWESENAIQYQSTEIAKMAGVFITIKAGRMQVKCSLHKFYNRLTTGTLENDNMFTLSDAWRAFETLFEGIGIDKERARITYFEIGLNIPTEKEPIQYIEIAQNILMGKVSKTEKLMFIDANYHINRQKTTEKRKTIKKVFKMYDKGFEKSDRRRTAPTDEKILRIETMYRRQNVTVARFFDAANLERITQTFFRDWTSLEFARTVTAEKGTKESQLRNAENILLLGRETYLNHIRNELDKGNLTARQHRTIREFVRDWDDNKHKYRMLPSECEREFKAKFKELFRVAKN